MIDSQKKFVFVLGLHRSGTSILFQCLKQHSQVSGFDGTGVPEDEGQHLQTQIPTAKSLGGPGMFAFHPDAPMREDHPLARPEVAEKLLAEWQHHWDPTKSVYLEKSPPTLLRARFFQALFPNSRFICVTRHPVAVGYATQKWSQSTIQDLIDHWRRAHEIFAEDQDQLGEVKTIKYEDFVANPEPVLHELHQFMGLAPEALQLEVRSGINDKYFDMWRDHCNVQGGRVRQMIEERDAMIRSFGYSLADPSFLGPSRLK